MLIHVRMGAHMNRNASISDNLCASYDGFSDTERRIADFILQNMPNVARLSVREIADKSNTSGATVSRFVRKIGYDSFADLRLAIAGEQGDADFTAGKPVSEVSLDDIDASVQFVLENKIQELQGTAKALDKDRVKRTINLILQSDNILFAAVGNSIPVCSNFAFRLGQIGIRATCPANTEMMILASLSLRRNDLVIIVSSSGYSHRLETIVDNAEDSGTPIIFITSNPMSKLVQRADVVLSAISRDQLLTGPQFATHVPEDFIIETLFMFLLTYGKNVGELTWMERKSLGRDKETRPTFS